jgi:hypothetical protein
MFYPDDVPELILSVEESDLRFAGLDDRLDEDRVTLGEQVKEHKGQILDSHLESGLVPSLNPAPTNLGELEMPTGGDIDTPALLKVLFPSLDPSQEPAVRWDYRSPRTTNNRLAVGRLWGSVHPAEPRATKGVPKLLAPRKARCVTTVASRATSAGRAPLSRTSFW